MNKRIIAAGAVALATGGLGIAQTSPADAGGGRLNSHSSAPRASSPRAASRMRRLASR